MKTPCVQSTWKSYAEFFAASGYARFPQEHRHSRGRFPFQMMSVQMGGHEYTDPAVNDLVLTVSTAVSGNGEWAWSFGDGWQREKLRAGRMLLAPPNTESQWSVAGSRDLLVLIVPSITIKSVLGTASPPDITAAFAPLSRESWHDPLVEILLTALWASLPAGRIPDQLFADGSIVTLISQLLRLSGTLSQSDQQKFAISPCKLRRVTEYARAHLDSQLDLFALASVAGLSVRHFARAFRQQTGETPHRWLMSLRAEKAKELLASRDATLSEIADACGFADQSHMTALVKRATGVTPRRWRELHLSGSGVINLADWDKRSTRALTNIEAAAPGSQTLPDRLLGRTALAAT